MKPNKLLVARIITSIHERRGRVVKLKSTRHQFTDDILIKRNFNSLIRKQCIQDDSSRYRDFHKSTCLREKIAKPLHLNEVGRIFPYLFYLNKYTLITTISYMIDEVEASQSFQTNRSKMIGILYCLTLKVISQHSIDSLLQDIQKIIIIYNKD